MARQRRAPTVFPPDPAPRSLPDLLYHLYHHELAGTRLTRWLLWASIALGVLLAVATPLGWIGLAAVALLDMVLIGMLLRWRRRDFIRFEEGALPPITPQRLAANGKIAIYATGHFTVEGQYRRFTHLPGFARTFATGEHAVLCLLRDQKLAGLAQRPSLDIGMWYIFFTPEQMSAIRYGHVQINGSSQPAIAVDYTLTIPPANGSQRAKTLEETVYLACVDPTETPLLLADIAYAFSPQTDVAA